MSEKNFARIDVKNLNRKSYLLQIFSSYAIVLPIVALFYRISFSGYENVPQDRKFICAPNHISYLDPYLVFLATRKPMTYMAKQELFQNKFMRWALPKLCAFAVNREKLEVSTIKSVKDIMKTKNWNLCIFPQGGIFRNRKIEKINRGFIFIAKMSKTDIVPMSITGSEEYNWIPFKGKIEVKVGTPISWELSEDEIHEQWGNQVSKMAGYEYVPDLPESENETKKLSNV